MRCTPEKRSSVVCPKLSASSIATGRPSRKPMRIFSNEESCERGLATIHCTPSRSPSLLTWKSRSKSLEPNRIEAGDAGAALAQCDRLGRRIDLVLTELMMPEMSGVELVRALTAREPRLKILYMSGYRDALARAAPEGTPETLLLKPFTPDVLLSRVREVLDRG